MQNRTEFSVFIGNNYKGTDGRFHTFDPDNVATVVKERLEDHFTGWTITQGRGFWGGMTEPSTIITIIDDGAKLPILRDAVRLMKYDLAQESIFICFHAVYAEEV